MLLALIIAATPLGVSAEQPSDLFVQVSAVGGASVFDVEPELASGGARGVVVGVRAGLRASRPPLVLGGGRLGLLPALEVRHDLGSGRTEWFGSAALTVTVWKLWLTMSVGYGLSVLGDGAPRHLFDTTAGVAMKFGDVWVGLSVDSAMRVGTTGRTLQVLSTLGWEFALPDT